MGNIICVCVCVFMRVGSCIMRWVGTWMESGGQSQVTHTLRENSPPRTSTQEWDTPETWPGMFLFASFHFTCHDPWQSNSGPHDSETSTLPRAPSPSSQWTAMLPSVSNVHLLSWGLLRVSSLEENPALLGSQDCIWITRVSISKVSSKPHLIRLFHNFFSYSDAIDSSLISSLDLPICVFNVFSFIVPSAYREGELGRTAKCCLLLSWAMVNVFVLKFLWFYISFQ